MIPGTCTELVHLSIKRALEFVKVQRDVLGKKLKHGQEVGENNWKPFIHSPKRLLGWPFLRLLTTA